MVEVSHDETELLACLTLKFPQRPISPYSHTQLPSLARTSLELAKKSTAVSVNLWAPTPGNRHVLNKGMVVNDGHTLDFIGVSLHEHPRALFVPRSCRG